MAGDLKTDSQRLVDLKAALKRAHHKHTCTLEDLASLWGVTKPRFVNKRREFHRFPEHAEKVGNAYLYPTRDALKAMIEYLEKHKEVSTSRAKRLGELIGTDQMAEHIAGGFSIAELAKANQLAAELEERQRDQGLYAPISEVHRVIGMVFSEISEFVSNLANVVDPHGKLPPSARATLDSKAHEELLRLHGNLKGMLSTNAVDSGTRKPARKSGAARTRRKRPTGRPRKA